MKLATHRLLPWLSAAALGLVALTAGAHEPHSARHEHGLRGGICTSEGGDRYRVVEAIALRREARRDLRRLPLRRERLGFQDTLILVEPEAHSHPEPILVEE